MVAAIERVQPQFVVVDSIQTIADERIASSPGSTTQVRECAQQLVVEAKRRGMALLIVGHVTKDGALAGPRTLEHVVDTVLSFEGDRHHALRLLRVVKHRFGATSELGLFEMHGSGLVGVPDPSQLFLADRRRGVPGSVVVPTVEGQRPMLVEVQSLTVPMPQGGNPRRTAQGIDTNRLAMLLAVIERRLGLDVGRARVYAPTVGGVRLTEPGSDLGVALAIISSYTDIPVPPIWSRRRGRSRWRAASGRPHRATPPRARRLGYRQAIVPSRPSVEGISRSPSTPRRRPPLVQPPRLTPAPRRPFRAGRRHSRRHVVARGVLAGGASASSRAMMIWSAPLAAALSKRSGRSPGTNSSVRAVAMSTGTVFGCSTARERRTSFA